MTSEKNFVGDTHEEHMLKGIAKEKEYAEKVRAAHKGGGAKTSRSETVTVRLDPQVRYLAELAGRKQRRTLSSFIEWAIQKGLESVPLEEHQNGDVTVADMASKLWDVDESDKFAKLAIHYPDLLTHEEQVLWKIVRENGWLWRGGYKGAEREWTWEIKESSFVFERLREKWDLFVEVSKGITERSRLPTWPKTDPKSPEKPAPNFSDMDDDIPF